MKKIIFKISVITFLIFTAISPVCSQPPPPADHSQTGDQVPGGGAPIGNGTFILLFLSALYSGRKVYRMQSTNKTEE
jgi:hypothetical protein